MKRKDVEKLLKKEVNAFDGHDSLSEIKGRLGMNGTETHVQRDGSVVLSRRRNIFIALIAAFAAVVLIVTASLVVWRLGTKNPSSSRTPIFTAKTDIYTLAAVSTGELLSEMTVSGSSAVMSSSSDRAYGRYGEEADETLTAELNEYMLLADTLISTAAVNPVVEENVDGYMYKTTTTIVTASGESAVYIMYYNETFYDDEDDRRDRDDDDDERESEINGKLIVGDNEYTVEGKREIEEEDGESEMEVEFVAYTDKDTYVKFKQEIENDEQSYAYEVVENGRKVDEFELEIEKEHDETEISLKTGNTEYKLKEETDDGETVITVEYSKNGRKYELVAVPQENGKYRYYHK